LDRDWLSLALEASVDRSGSGACGARFGGLVCATPEARDLAWRTPRRVAACARAFWRDRSRRLAGGWQDGWCQDAEDEWNRRFRVAGFRSGRAIEAGESRVRSGRGLVRGRLFRGPDVRGRIVCRRAICGAGIPCDGTCRRVLAGRVSRSARPGGRVCPRPGAHGDGRVVLGGRRRVCAGRHRAGRGDAGRMRSVARRSDRDDRSPGASARGVWRINGSTDRGTGSSVSGNREGVLR